MMQESLTNIKFILFSNNSRSINVIKFLKKKKANIQKIVITKKNLKKDLINFLKKNNLKFILINNLKDKKIKKIMVNSDMGLVCGFPHIFKQELINLPRYGLLNLHAGKLPKYRGGSPLNWQILNNEKYFSISVIKINKEIDYGDIVSEKKFRLLNKYKIEDLHKIANTHFPKLLYKSIIKIIRKSKIKKQKQNIKSYYPQRSEEDSKIYLNKIKFKDLKLLLRATSKLYHNPFFFYKNKKITIKHFTQSKKKFKNLKGRVFHHENKTYVKIKDKIILINNL